MLQEKMAEIVVMQEPDEEFARFLQSKLARFNDMNSTLQDPRAQPLHIEVVDENGKFIGGVSAITYWGWVVIELFYINEQWRGQGIGKTLLERTEAEAKKRGCERAHTSTYDFQALEFYRKMGYAVIGHMDDYPDGHTFYWLRKDFA